MLKVHRRIWVDTERMRKYRNTAGIYFDNLPEEFRCIEIMQEDHFNVFIKWSSHKWSVHWWRCIKMIELNRDLMEKNPLIFEWELRSSWVEIWVERSSTWIEGGKRWGQQHGAAPQDPWYAPSHPIKGGGDPPHSHTSFPSLICPLVDVFSLLLASPVPRARCFGEALLKFFSTTIANML